MIITVDIICGRYQRSTSAISIGKYDCLALYTYFLTYAEVIDIFCLHLTVAPIRYARLAAHQMSHFIKFEDFIETLNQEGEGGNSVIPEMPRLHEEVRASMFFC